MQQKNDQVMARAIHSQTVKATKNHFVQLGQLATPAQVWERYKVIAAEIGQQTGYTIKIDEPQDDAALRARLVAYGLNSVLEKSAETVG